jgi:hypothetical protein
VRVAKAVVGGGGRGGGRPVGRGRGGKAGKAAVRVSQIVKAPQVIKAITNSHTIMLLKTGNTNIWAQYDTVQKAIEGVIHMYEEQLKRLQPGKTNIKYSVDDLYTYVDRVSDLSCMCAAPGGLYKPYDKAWIKRQIYALLKREA